MYYCLVLQMPDSRHIALALTGHMRAGDSNSHEGGRRTGSRALPLVIAALTLALMGSGPPAQAVDGYRTIYSGEVHPGVVWSHLRADSPQLALDVAHVDPGAPVRLVPVISGGQLYENPPAARHSTPTNMCAASGGVVCVNADFWICPSCGPPGGGVVIDGVTLRTPTHLHPQVTMLDDGRMVTDDLQIGLRLEAVFEPDDPGAIGGVLQEPEPPRRKTVFIDELNRPSDNGVVLYSPTWATTTQQTDALEAVFQGPVAPIGSATPVALRTMGWSAHDIPTDGFVLAATGDARDRFRDQMAAIEGADRVELHVTANMPARMSSGGHPVILRDGQHPSLDQADGKVRNRHPRTLIGWNDVGDLWLVTIDGRQKGHSVGVTLREAADHLLRLGATEGMNLDGGGSSTFVTGVPCPDGTAPCVRNRPSDGRERRLSTALALVPTGGTTLARAPMPAPPPPPPAPPTTAPPPPPPTTDPPPATTTTTTIPPTTTTTTTTLPPTTTTTIPPTTTTEAPAPPVLATGSLQVHPEPEPPSRRGPATAASLALVAVASFTTKEWSRQRSQGRPG